MMLVSIGILGLCFMLADEPAIPLPDGYWLIMFNNRNYAIPISIPLNYNDKF